MDNAKILEACTQEPRLIALVVITSDKRYENKKWKWGYIETGQLVGQDAYSASKANFELVVGSNCSTFYHQCDTPLKATTRAGKKLVLAICLKIPSFQI